MSNPLDTDAGSELFESYSAEFRLVEADLAQKLDQIPELSGEPRKAAINQAERALEEAEELVSSAPTDRRFRASSGHPLTTPRRPVTTEAHLLISPTNRTPTSLQLGQMNLEKANIPTNARSKANQRYRDYQTSIDKSQRKLRTLRDDRSALFGDRYSDNPSGGPSDPQHEQRQQLLSGSDRLDRSTQRLKASQRLAYETEAIGASTLEDLGRQREVIVHTNDTLLRSEGYVDRSVKTLKGMARR